jgi:exopolysaccharide biosynthesis protein
MIPDKPMYAHCVHALVVTFCWQHSTGKQTLLTSLTAVSSAKNTESFRYRLRDGSHTTGYAARYPAASFKAKLVTFTTATVLQDWCAENNVLDAISGGFFDRENDQPLGEIWIGGKLLPHTPTAGSKLSRGSLLINGAGQLDMAHRSTLPIRPQAGLLQAGPLLVGRGLNLMTGNTDPEGFSSSSGQYDSDITRGRFPRAAIARNERYFWTITADGYNPASAGLTFEELAELCLELGATSALNLDGGGSASHIVSGNLINQPRSRDYLYSMCRPIFNAIIFTKK